MQNLIGLGLLQNSGGRFLENLEPEPVVPDLDAHLLVDQIEVGHVLAHAALDQGVVGLLLDRQEHRRKRKDHHENQGANEGNDDQREQEVGLVVVEEVGHDEDEDADEGDHGEVRVEDQVPVLLQDRVVDLAFLDPDALVEVLDEPEGVLLVHAQVCEESVVVVFPDREALAFE